MATLKAVRAILASTAALAALALGCARDERASEPAITEQPFDVVVVGGGLAGLTAAHALHGKRLLLLEKEQRLGGKIDTRHRDGLSYELGALFEYDPHWLPPRITPSELVAGTPRVGFAEGGEVVFDVSVQEVASRVLARRAGVTGPEDMPVQPALASAPEQLKRAFFGLIDPGPRAAYLSVRQGDWATTHSTRRRKQGNAELIAALSAASHARIVLGATATRVRDAGEHIEVHFNHEGRMQTVVARAAVVATPAHVTTDLLRELPEDSPIRRVRYAPGIVVALAVRAGTMERFSYIAAAERGISGVFSHTHGERRVLTVYYAREQAAAVDELDDRALVARTVEHLSALGAGRLTMSDVEFSDVKRWPALAPVISEDPYAAWSEALLRPTQRIFLAGDYTDFGAAQLPFGMPAAVASGRAAAQAVRAYLDGGATAQASADAAPRATQDSPEPAGAEAAQASADAAPRAAQDSPERAGAETAPASQAHGEARPSPGELAAVYRPLGLPPPLPSDAPPLTQCELFEIGGSSPEYRGALAEGNVAPYGMLLLAERDPAIVSRLLASELNGLWEYNRGYGATAADTTMVLEGLLESGVDRERLVRSLERIRDVYYDPKSGGFATVESGRARYWTGPSADTTAQVAYLMQRIAPERFPEELAGARRYLLAQQRATGEWSARWFPSRVLATAYAVRFLAAQPDSGPTARALAKATGFLTALQRSDGSIMGSTLDTSSAALALAAVGTHGPQLNRARAWLAQRVAQRAPAGEVILHYWFDDAQGGRTFFVCKDRGALAQALARYALRTSEQPARGRPIN